MAEAVRQSRGFEVSPAARVATEIRNEERARCLGIVKKIWAEARGDYRPGDFAAIVRNIEMG